MLDAHLLAVTIPEPGLQEGDEIAFVYGAGPLGARADRFAEREAAFHVSVDGDGDGVRSVLAEPVRLDVGARPGGRPDRPRVLRSCARASPSPCACVCSTRRPNAGVAPTGAPAGQAAAFAVQAVIREGGATEPVAGELDEGGLRSRRAPADRDRSPPRGGLRRGLRSRVEPRPGGCHRSADPLGRPPRPLEPLGRYRHRARRTSTATRGTSPPSTWRHSPTTTTGACPSSTPSPRSGRGSPGPPRPPTIPAASSRCSATSGRTGSTVTATSCTSPTRGRSTAPWTRPRTIRSSCGMPCAGAGRSPSRITPPASPSPRTGRSRPTRSSSP